jgi:transcription initiation factor TFIIIB Brf1 subunit/transcription initiation factor TFIIB
VCGLPQIERLKREEFFLDICDSNQMNSGVAAKAVLEYDQLIQQTSPLKIAKKKVTAYALYSAALKEGAGRDPEEIAAFVGVDKSDLCAMQTEFPQSPELQKATRFLARYCYFLGINYRQQREIEALHEQTSRGDGYNTRTVIAALISIYCEMHRAEIGMAEKKKNVASVCNVSPSALRRCANVLRAELEENGGEEKQ